MERLVSLAFSGTESEKGNIMYPNKMVPKSHEGSPKDDEYEYPRRCI